MGEREWNSEDLLAVARRAAESAYCRYSDFRVGAAVVAEGKLFTGANVENASYGLTICAERVAIFNAVTAGHREITAVAVACIDATAERDHTSRMPCGACLQVLAEFAVPSCQVHVDNAGTFALAALLPHAFKL